MSRSALKPPLAAATAVVLALAACDDRAQVATPEPAPLSELAAIAELPYAEPAPVKVAEPVRGYRWAERAYGMQRTFYDAPPDYGFEYDGVEPLVWESADDWALYAEPWDEGYRYYYYQPGAAYPYFVRDFDYGYAFGPTGVLIAVFDSGGRYLPYDVVYRVAPTAGRYFARGRSLRRFDEPARRIRVSDDDWVAAAPRVTRTAEPWLRAGREERAWRAWRERVGARELRRFEAETQKRDVATRDWRERVARRDLSAGRGFDARRDAPQAARIEREAVPAERRQAQVEQRREIQAARQQTQLEQSRQQQAARQQAQAEQRQQAQAARQQAQAEQQRQQQVARRKARAEQREQAEAQREAQLEQGRQQQAARKQAQAEQQRQARARAADESGQPASARERDRERKD